MALQRSTGVAAGWQSMARRSAAAPDPGRSGWRRGSAVHVLVLAASLARAQDAPTPSSYVGAVLLPSIHGDLTAMMERPFEALRFSVAAVELGSVDGASASDAMGLNASAGSSGVTFGGVFAHSSYSA